MKPQFMRWARPVVMAVALGALAGCGLPQVGPNKSQIFRGSVQQEGDAFIVEVNDRVTRATAVVPALGFSGAFQSAATLTADTIRPGDTVGLTIWENVDDGLLSGQGQSATVLEEVQVDSDGFIFVPYAGRLRASGNTPEQLRGLITEQLQVQTPDPQVQVRRLAGDGSTVSIVGAITGQGVFPIERPTRTLATMLASAGGLTIEPEIAQVTVLRGGQTGRIWFQDLFSNPELDIALRGGDRILVEGDTRSFTAMGATAQQARVPFESQDLSALEAIAQVGGLLATSADATGVFVFRNETDEIAESVLGRNDLEGAQRMVYVLNLTDPNGLFLARDFVIRDGDTLYVTEAPFTQWTKVLSTLVAPLGTVASVQTVFGD